MNFSSNMENKIKILSPPLLERDSISLRNFRKYCMKKIETEINHSGGIGGFPIEIQNLLIKKIMKNILDMKKLKISLDLR